jgi:hypothetical protein
VLHHGLDLLSRAAQPKLIFDLLVIKSALAEAMIRVDQLQSERAPANPRRDPRPGSTVAVAEKVEMIEKLARQAQPAARPAPPEGGAMDGNGGLGFSFMTEKKPTERPKDAPPARVMSEETKSWDKLIELCFASRPMLAILLESVVEWEFPKTSADKFRLGFRERDQSKSDQLQHRAIREQFGLLTESQLGFRAIPEGFISTQTGESLAEKNARLQRETRDRKMHSILNHQIVLEARSLFGAELTEIQMAEKEA